MASSVYGAVERYGKWQAVDGFAIPIHESESQYVAFAIDVPISVCVTFCLRRIYDIH